MSAYYNEHDPKAAAWLRELIKRGLIADGEVDERSILDVRPDDIRGYTQCHFFAGIGGWSYALRLAGWPDDRPVWTGSPPCQPFSAAGRRLGRDDERHLAPHFVGLVRACRPEMLFGEQVASAEVFGGAATRAGASADGAPRWAWLDDLCDRLEASHYAVGATDIPAAGVGAPHIRQRTFFGAVRLADAMPAGRAEGRAVAGHGSLAGDGIRSGLADAASGGCQSGPGIAGVSAGKVRHVTVSSGGIDGSDDRLADARRDEQRRGGGAGREGQPGSEPWPEPCGCGEAGWLADADGGDASAEGIQRGGQYGQQPEDGGAGGLADSDSAGRIARQRHDQAAGYGHPSSATGGAGGLADADDTGPQGHWQSGGFNVSEGRPDAGRHGAEGGLDCRLADADCEQRSKFGDRITGNGPERSRADELGQQSCGGGVCGGDRRPSPTNGFWRDADWLFCRDGKWRPVEPGTFPLADGVSARVGRLRGYGNAIVPQVAAQFVIAFMEVQNG